VDAGGQRGGERHPMRQEEAVTRSVRSTGVNEDILTLATDRYMWRNVVALVAM